MNKKPIVIFLLLMFTRTTGFSQEVIDLWPNGAPGAILNQEYEEMALINAENELTHYSQVTHPTIEVFIPENPNGSGVLIFPGGGYARLSILKEGYKVAKELNEKGISAFVVKYRLPSDVIMNDKKYGPLQDAQEAIRLVRSHAEKFQLDANKIGVLGFSAGGHLVSTLHTQYERATYQSQYQVSARPDFAVLIYPVISMNDEITHQGSKRNLLGENPTNDLVDQFSNDLQVHEEVAPVFLVHGTDDIVVPVQNSLNYYHALLEHNIPSAFHIYQQGEHGFGLGNNDENKRWIDDLGEWIKLQTK